MRIGSACSTHGIHGIYRLTIIKKPERKRSIAGPRVDGRIILRYVRSMSYLEKEYEWEGYTR
jgi:hypothetical protein